MIFAGYQCQDGKCPGSNVHSDVKIEFAEGFWHNGEYTIDAVIPEIPCAYCKKPRKALSVRLWLNTPEGEAHERSIGLKQR